MKTYISLLRGINVSGHNMIKMVALKSLFTDLGFTDVRTYIQSGNVVFRGKEVDTDKLQIRISGAIKKEFGYEVPVIVIELGDMKKIVKENPFVKDKLKQESFFHLSLLSADPDKLMVGKIADALYLPDEFQWKHRAIYLYIPGGYGKTKLNNSFFETKLKLKATTRNWRTVNELIKMAEEISK